MLNRTTILATAAVVSLATAGTAHAGQTFKFSSDTGSGGVNSWTWDGGDQGNLEGAMNYAANRNGNFVGTDFRRNQVNMFLIDFTNSSDYSGAGLTLFVMWGNEREVDGPFAADVDVSPLVTEDDDDGSYSGSPHIYALGAGVTINDDGPVSVDIDVENDETPVGFAITNLPDVSGFGQTGITNLQFTLAGAIRKVRLLGYEQGRVWQGVDDDGNDDIFTDGIVLMVPAPHAAIWGLAGLGGLAFASRRRKV